MLRTSYYPSVAASFVLVLGFAAGSVAAPPAEQPIPHDEFLRQGREYVQRFRGAHVPEELTRIQQFAGRYISATVEMCAEQCRFKDRAGQSDPGPFVTHGDLDAFKRFVDVKAAEYRMLAEKRGEPGAWRTIAGKYEPQAIQALNQMSHAEDPRSLHHFVIAERRALISELRGQHALDLARLHADAAVQRTQGKDASALVFKSEADSEAGDFRSAAQAADRALRLSPGDRSSLVLRANALYQTGDYSGAERDATAALGVDPRDPQAAAILQLTRDRVGDLPLPAAGPTGPGAEAGDAVLADGGRPGGRPGYEPGADNINESKRLAQAAVIKLSIGDDEKALELARQAVELNSQNARAMLLMAQANLRLGRTQDALRNTDAAMKLVGRDRAVLDTRAYVLNRLGDYASAKAVAEESLSLNAGDADAWYNLANAEAGLGHRKAMLAALQQAARINSRYRGLLDAALQSTETADLRLLFSGAAAAAAAAPPPSSSEVSAKRIGFAILAIATLFGGFLIALGLLHSIFPDVARSAATSITRTLGGTPAGAPPPENEARTVLARSYEVVRQIGAGGMGTVYEAIDLSLQRTVAIKKMREEIRSDPRERERFLKEAKLVAALHHPNIVDIFSIVDDDQDDVYLVFEYVQGETLDSLLRSRRRIPFDELRGLFTGVCGALDFAHKHGIIHRDLKPSNIMVNSEGVVKVMDFGVARQAKDAITKMALTNTICGTPSYMAPEAEQGIVRRESDVFSLAVCFYELLTGVLPFPGYGAGLLLNKMNGTFKPPSTFVPHLPAGLDELMAKALRADPEERLASPGEFAKALNALSAVR
ncbi:MAG: protein kinase [Elusimicrobia bacterium]|nr:protein kinase [Elusimicrobiota bacterium]